ncbi:putative phage membrane protein [Burkholderia aenigmatica]|nr:putative phage membrane protein [Burkholderia aenigmatica]
MRAPITRLPDCFPLAVLGALYLIACGVAPAFELLAGVAR